MNLLTEVFDFFLPRFCPACNKKLSSEEKVVCPECLSRIQYVSDKRLKIEFDRKFLNKKFISEFTSLYIFEKDKELQNIIHSFKYSQRFLTGKFLGEIFGEAKKDIIYQWKIDMIVPIPLHHLKKAERGYNQSYFIAKGISKVVDIPVAANVVKRKRFTQSQTAMNLKEREENISGAFMVRNNKILKDKNILLVDDVITTGATTNECGKILLENGANRVCAVSIAIAD